MAWKYVIKGRTEIVRTSGNEYHYGVFSKSKLNSPKFKAISCSKTYEGAVKLMKDACRYNVLREENLVILEIEVI
jgi:hypothetical protein